MTGQMSERDELARAIVPEAWFDAPGEVEALPGVQEAQRVALARADAALAWFAERVEALLDRYDDPGYGMQEDEWRFVRDLRALYTTPTTESEDR